MFDLPVFGARLKSLRTAKSLTQEEAAERIGVSGQAVSKWEKGECLPDLWNLKLLGRLYRVSLDDLLDMGYDGRHSYEDAIKPVEECYEELAGRIAVLGGIDVDFMATASPEEVFARCRKMAERTASRGGYALGTGNSVPVYVPDVNFFAMNEAFLSLG